MRKMILLLLTAGFMATQPALAKIQGKEIAYKGDGIIMKGYIAYDDKFKGKRPGVIVVHEWWGHNDYARKRADMLAKMGYTALAVDMYGDGKQANHPDDAGKFSAEVSKNMDSARARFEAGMKTLKADKTVRINIKPAWWQTVWFGRVVDHGATTVDGATVSAALSEFWRSV